MEFASELVVRAALAQYSIVEVPTTLASLGTVAVFSGLLTLRRAPQRAAAADAAAKRELAETLTGAGGSAS